MSETNTSSDWIYILLTLLTAGLGMVKSLSKKNKKADIEIPAPENDTEERPEYTRGNMMVDEYINEDEQLYPEGMLKPEYESEAGANSHELPADKSDEPNTENTDFDLRKAIVYNEILNRKYE